MNKTVIGIILGAVLVITGAIAFFVIREHRNLVED